MDNCFICRKQRGQEAAPPGGYIHQDQYWMGCHAPGKLGSLGMLFMEGQPHFHSWMVPLRKDINERGLKLFARDDSCSDKEAGALADKLRATM